MPKLGESISSEAQEKLDQLADKLGQADPKPLTDAEEGRADERVALFIDGENLIPRSEAGSGLRLDFRKLRDLLAAGRPVNLSQWFDSYKDGAERERKARLYLALTLSGFTVRALPLRNGHKLKSRIDHHLQAEISDRLLLEDRGEEPYTHTFILASGDSDFYPIVELLKRHGRRVEIAYLGDTLSYELRTAADRLIDLGEHLEELAFTSSGRRPQPQLRQGQPGSVSARPRHSHGSVAITVVPSRRTRLRRLLRRLSALKVGKRS